MADQHEHHYRPIRGASTPSKMLPGEIIPQTCGACSTRYPCAYKCAHIDCLVERGEPLPEWVTEVVEPTHPDMHPDGSQEAA